MARKDLARWGREHPDLATAATNLWISGVSERAIFERYRALVKDPPSYREIRASFKEHGLAKRADATELRQRGQRFELSGSLSDGHESAFQKRRKVQYTEPAKARLEENMVKGYLAREVVSPETDLVEGDFQDFITSDFEVGS